MAKSFKTAGGQLVRWATQIAVVAILTLAPDSIGIAYGPVGQVREQSPFGNRPIKRVESEAEIRATTPDDLARAAYFEFAVGKKLMDVEGVILAGPETPPPLPPPPAELSPTPPLDQLRESICAADAVIVGEATKDRVLLNKSETFLITVHAVSVSEWIRARGNRSEVSVSVAGGVVQVGEKTLHSRSGGFPNLFKPAMLRLRTIPGGGGYALNGDPIAIPPPGAKSNREGPSEREAWLTRYRDAAASCPGLR